MAVIADNPRATGAGHAYSTLIESSEREWNDAHARALQSITPDDVLDELCEYEAELRAAGDDAAAIGLVYLAAKASLAQRLADRMVGA